MICSLPLVDPAFVQDEAGQEESDGEKVEHEDPQRGEEAEVTHDRHYLKGNLFHVRHES